MAPRVLVVDHHDSYTWNLVHLIAGVTGAMPEVVEHDEPGLLGAIATAGHTHLVLSPGPGHPANTADFALGRGVFELGLPVLGVCLGMQALVQSFGGTVERELPAHGEVARIDHDGAGVFRGLPQGFAAVRYHSLAATRIAGPLAVTATAEPVTATAEPVTATAEPVTMGVRHRSLPLEGVQFHPESILSEHGAAMIANFLEIR